MAKPTLNNPELMSEFAQSCVEIYRDWKKLGGAMRRSKIQDAVRTAASNVTLPDFGFFFRDMGTRGGELNAQNWRLDINTNVSDTHDVPLQTFLWFCSVLYHETRHGEQWYRCAQGVLAGELTNPWLDGVDVRPSHIAAVMFMPLSVIQHAEARGEVTWNQYRDELPVRAWFDSIWGANRTHRGTVLSHPDIMIHGSAGNLAYTNLPEEVDAYATQHSVEALLEPLLDEVVQADVQAPAPVPEVRREFEPNNDPLAQAIRGVKLKHVAMPERGRNVARAQAAVQKAPEPAVAKVVVSGAQQRVRDIIAAHAALIERQHK